MTVQNNPKDIFCGALGDDYDLLGVDVDVFGTRMCDFFVHLCRLSLSSDKIGGGEEIYKRFLVTKRDNDIKVVRSTLAMITTVQQ